jgi:hypothetical protein
VSRLTSHHFCITFAAVSFANVRSDDHELDRVALDPAFAISTQGHTQLLYRQRGWY